MNRAKKDVQELLDQVQVIQEADVQLFLITRTLGPGIRRNAEVVGKYNYLFFEVRIDKELREEFRTITLNQIKRYTAHEDVHVATYQTIDDDEEKLLTFSTKKRALPFAEMAKAQIDKGPAPAQNLLSLEKHVWAYCIKISQGEEEPLLAFRRMPRTKVMVDSEEKNKRSLSALLTFFKPGSTMLQKFEGTTVGFDRRVDCVLQGDMFYIFSKSGFERIAGLEEEFQSHAEETIQQLVDTEMLVGHEILREEMKKSMTLLKRIARLSEDPRVATLTKKEVEKMALVATRNGKKLKCNKDGKIELTDKDDVELLVQLLNDYFVESALTGKRYGAMAKTVLGG